MRVSELIEGVVGAAAIIWTAAMSIPLWNLATRFLSQMPFGDVYTAAESLLVFSIGLILVVCMDYFLFSLVARGGSQ